MWGTPYQTTLAPTSEQTPVHKAKLHINQYVGELHPVEAGCSVKFSDGVRSAVNVLTGPLQDRRARQRLCATEGRGHQAVLDFAVDLKAHRR